MLLGTGDIELLGRPSAWAWGVYALSWLAPAVAAVAAVQLWRKPGGPTGRAASALAWLQITACAWVLVWLAAHGWFGLKLWDA
jgi:hypothetical protein